MRGRLVAVAGLDEEGATSIKVFVELQNLDAQASSEKRLLFNRDSSLVWEMTDGNGKVLAPGKPVVAGWSYASTDSHVLIPANSVRRLEACTAGYYLLDGPMALVFFQGLINTPPWHLAADGHGPYFLSATFRGLDSEGPKTAHAWRSALMLPPVILPITTILVAWRQRGINVAKIGPESTKLLGSK